MTDIVNRMQLEAEDLPNPASETVKCLSLGADEIERLRALVVMRFDHDHPPQFSQGYDPHELTEPVTAEHCRWFVQEIERLRTNVTFLDTLKREYEDAIGELQDKLAASQAREEMLRSWLSGIRVDLDRANKACAEWSLLTIESQAREENLRKWIEGSPVVIVSDDSIGAAKASKQKILAASHDDSALRQIKAEYEAREEKLLDFIQNAPVSSGVCCCGEGMDHHSDPMSCGHSPRDQWDWSVQCLVEQAKKHDDSVLKERLKAERERCAKACDDLAYAWRGANSQIVECVKAIRAMGGE